MEDIDTTENERETQYISDEEVKAFDCELGEEIKIDLSEDTLEAKKAPTGKSKGNLIEVPFNAKCLFPLIFTSKLFYFLRVLSMSYF